MRHRVKRYKPSIVQAPEHIPAEYKAIGHFHKTDSGLHRQLNRLCERREVMAFRLGEGGPWFVREDHIAATQEQRRTRRQYRGNQGGKQDDSESLHQFRVNGVAIGPIEAATVVLCEIDKGITLMNATLERLTAAVELIATQPKTAQQELVSTFESNGFHQ